MFGGIIYIHRISNVRITGISPRNFRMFRQLCGESTLKKVVLITNMRGEVSRDIEEARENELITNVFKPALDKGAQLARHYNTTQSAYDIIRRITENSPTLFPTQWPFFDEYEDIPDTSAREAINRELNEQIRHRQAEMKAVQEEVMQALKERDKEFEQDIRKLQEQMRVELERMASHYNEEKRRMEAEMWRRQEEARVERQRLIDCLSISLRQCPQCR